MCTRLQVPIWVMNLQLTQKSWIGAELRDFRKQLVGLVISVDAGILQVKGSQQPTGIITFLCVSPHWRKKGVTNCLLRAVYVFAQPRRIQWFRNDGWTIPPTPPVLFQTRMARRRVRTLQASPKVRKIPWEEWGSIQPYFQQISSSTSQPWILTPGPQSVPLTELWSIPLRQGEL